MDATVEPVRWPDDQPAVVAFLCAEEWIFHSTPVLTPDAAAEVPIATDDVATFWLVERGERVGLIRLLDLDDVDDGSPRFDLRLATRRRGRGLGTFAVTWLTDHLFRTHPGLRRVEATTRGDNDAMQIVLDRCGYRLEGRFVEAWPVADGTYADALSYAILRREWAASSA